MRQSTLAFGQKPAAVETITPSAAGSSRLQGRKQADPGQQSLSSVASGSLQASSTQHPFFAKRERKQADAGQGSGEQASTEENDAPPSKRRALVPIAPRKRPALLDAPWPGPGEAHVQPYETLKSMRSASTGVAGLRRAADCENTNGAASSKPLLHAWPWSRQDPTQESPSDRLHLEESHDKTPSAFMSTEIDFKACEDGRGRIPVGLDQARRAALAPRHVKSTALWTDRWRPRQADCVLGNEEQAIYLREWLLALEVTSGFATAESGQSNLPPVRPILKRVHKKRGRPSLPKEMDDFLVGDNEEEEAWFDQFRMASSPARSLPTEEEDRTDGQRLSSSQGSGRDDLSFANAAHLSNVIVLVGPSGSGKTASVYACAHELGFEVFELYPGMGKRSGRDVVSIVGDLCRNHMVSSGGTGGGAFQKNAAKKESIFKSTSGRAKSTADSSTQSEGSSGLSTTKPRQSLILFEEVDVLYDDDKGFWPAVIELVADSRRPMILTCNDLSTIPLDDLPLQAILRFAMPASHIAVPYLQLVALYEGHQISAPLVADMYTNRAGAIEDLERDEELLIADKGPLHPRLSVNVHGSKLDLRQALLQLQFACEGAITRSDPTRPLTAPSSNALRPCIAASEHRSSADAILARPHSRALEALEPDHFEVTLDDLQRTAHVPLYKPRPRGDQVALPEYGREHEYRAALGNVPSGERARDTSHYQRRRLETSSAIDTVLAKLSIIPQSRIPSSEAVSDYAPLIYRMVHIDDDEEAAHRAHFDQVLEEARKLRAGPSTDEAAWTAASAGLARMGIRPSRQSSRLLLQRDDEGQLQLGLRESDFSRWLLLDDEMLSHARNFAPQWTRD